MKKIKVNILTMIIIICLFIFFQIIINPDCFYIFKIFDVSVGLFTMLMIIYVFIFMKKIKSPYEILNIDLSKIKLIVLHNLSLFLYTISIFYYYMFNLFRNKYDPMSDSIGIPIMYELITIAIFWLFSNIILLFILHYYTKPSIFYLNFILNKLHFEIPFIITFLVFFLFLIDSLYNGNIFSIISLSIILYIILSLRAGTYGNTIIRKSGCENQPENKIY
jgi:hypothetical protein